MQRISCSTATGEVSAIVSAVGAGLHALHVRGRDVIPLDTEFARTRWFSGHTLAPWPNRMRDGHWTFEGAELSAPANDGMGNALHGLVTHREFSVVSRTEASLRFELVLGGDAVYPFAVRVMVEYKVDAYGLTCSFGGRNESNQRVPFAIGTHPFFPFDDDCTLTINAANAFEVDDRLIPSGRLVDLGRWRAQPGEPVALSTFVADDCFTTLVRDASGLAHTVIGYPDGSSTDVWQDTGLPHTVIFTTRDFLWSDGGTKAIAIEPQTVPTNAFASGTDLTWLAPGEDIVVRWGVAATTS
jgi:aldose 1-epimerase